MFKKMCVMLCVMFMCAPVAADTGLAKISRSVELMELCQKDEAQCELLASLAKDNILFSYQLGVANDDWKRQLTRLISVDRFSCIEDVTPAQLRIAVNRYYGRLATAKIGADMMLFNALSDAAAQNCARLEV